MKYWLTLVLIMLSLICLAGCADEDDPSHGTPPDLAQIRVAQFSTDVPIVDVWVDGGLMLQTIGYGDVSRYLNVAAGSRHVQISATGTNPPAVLWGGNFYVYANTASTVAAAGVIPYLNVLVYGDDRTADSTRAKLRFIHLAPGALPVDVDLIGSQVSFSSVPYLLGTNYAALAAGTYDLSIAEAGTGTILLNDPDVSFAIGENYTLFMTGGQGNDSVEVVIVTDTD